MGGVDLTYQVHWKGIQVFKTYSTVINDRHSPSGYPDMLGTQAVVSEIHLPAESGGLKYVFGYNAADSGSAPAGTPSYGWGELNSVTTPTGAQAQYQYQLDGQNGPGWEYTWDVVLKKRITRKSLTYQQQYDGSSTLVTETWNYPDSGNNDNISSIVNPDGGIVTLSNDQQQRNVQTQQPDGTVIEKIWQANVPQGFPVHYVPDEWGVNTYDLQVVNSYVKTEFTSIRDANGNLSKTAIKDYSYDKNGNVTSVREYDWVDYSSVPRSNGSPPGIPGSAVLKRVTTNTYARGTPDASDSSSNHADSYWNSSSPSIKTALASSEVSNGSVTLSRAEFFYDNPATTGNLTQQKSWDSTKGGYSNPLSGANSVAVSHQYDGYGNPILTTDARGFQTQLYYGDVDGFTDLYPTQIKTAYQTSVQRTETRLYDFSTGLVKRVTDVDNNFSSSTTYDVFGRPKLVKAAEGTPEETRTATDYDDVLRHVIVSSDLSNLGDGKLVNIQHYDQLGRIRLARQLEDAATQSATVETQGIKVQTRYLVPNPCQPDNTPACLNANAASLGSYQLVSNPYRAASSASSGSEGTMGWTRSKSDKGGRLVEVQTFGGAGLPWPWGPNTASSGAVTTAYDANFTTVTDQAEKVRRSMTDGLGRLARVDEPNDNGNLGLTTDPVQPTSYTYDALSNLTNVAQGSQARTFAYSSLGRLTSATNPESGIVSYQYDANGNLTKKTDARNVVTDYAYDALNRNTSVVYSDGTPSVYRYYDGSVNGKGRLTWEDTTGVSANVVDIYDPLGRPKQVRQRFWVNGAWGDNFFVNADYNKAGQIVTERYPSQRTVNYSYDGAGRLTSFTGNLGDGTQRSYATGISYSSFGGMTREQYGTTTPLYNKTLYNIRGQMFDRRVSSVDDTWDWNRGRFIWYYSSNHVWGGSGTDNNGNVVYAENWIARANQVGDQGQYLFADTYTYDALNRLTAVSESSLDIGNNGSWQSKFAQAFNYDRWGNRQIKGYPDTWGTGINNAQSWIDQSNNRLYAPGDQNIPDPEQRLIRYDAAGNQKADYYSANRQGTRTYDAENRMKTATDTSNNTSTYVYDGNGRRIKRIVGSTETWQVYGLGGELMAEYAAGAVPTSPQKEYGYRNGELLITATAPVATDKINVVSATASSYWGSYVPANAIDGNVNTSWIAPAVAPQWIQLDLGSSRDLSKVRLHVMQDPAGQTTHEIWGGPATNNLTLLGTLSGSTSTLQWLELPTSATNVRYVKVLTTSSPSWVGWIDIEVYAAGGGASSNLALNKPTSQSSEGWGGASSRAVDGNTDGNWVNNSVTHTYYDNQAWWQVDLGASQSVQSVELWNRTDCCTERLTNFNVILLDGNQSVVSTVNVPGQGGTPTTVSISGTARYVKVQLVGTNYLSLAEVKVWGAAGGATYRASTDFTSTQGQNNWYYLDENGLPMTYDAVNNVWVGSEGPYQWLWNSGGHPGAAHDVVRQWRAPSAGSIRITGNASDGHTACGDGVIVSIKKGAEVLWQQTLANGNTTGLNYDVTTSVASSDQINFAIHRNGDPYCDSTTFDPTIAFTSGGGSSAQINWLVTDQLGTPRIILDQTGSLANVSRHDYLPFGEEVPANFRTGIPGYSTGDNVRQKFTSKERDNETGLDYFIARYYSSIQGRFTSVDPSRKSISGGNPQTWNRYSYTYNNPLVLVDDNGKWPKKTHDYLLRQALPGLTRDQIRQVQKGSHSVDVKRGVPITLLEGQAYKHAQTPGSYVRDAKGDVAAARTRAVGDAVDFVHTTRSQAAQEQSDFAKGGGKGLSPTALHTFGASTHPPVDNTSPAHSGFQVYSVPTITIMVPIPGSLGGMTAVTVVNQVQWAKELLDHDAIESRPPTPEEESAAIKEIRDGFGNVFGQEELQRAITPPPPGPVPQPAPDPRKRPR